MPSKPADQIEVEVAYARADKQLIIKTFATSDDNLRDVVVRSGITSEFPEIDLDNMQLGIFGKVAKLTEKLHPGDRIEIYRPLLADPKEVRRRRAAEGKRMGRGGGDLEPKSKPD
ncbi:MAG TPA: RnfH family protein [Gammaproteobacteria bacterium]|nr:RnfH family protein [Gammaproteobacteria bacterium]